MTRIRTFTVPALAAAAVVGGLTSLPAQAVTPPHNNQFQRAESLTGGGCNASADGDIFGATGQRGERAHFSLASRPRQSAWSVWRSPVNGIVAVDTVGSDFDTILAVYRGVRVGRLTQIASDDDTGGGFASSLTFNARAGVTYRIAVDSFGSAEGNYLLNVTC